MGQLVLLVNYIDRALLVGIPLLWQPLRLASPGQEQVPVFSLKTKPSGQVIKLAWPAEQKKNWLQMAGSLCLK